MKTARRLSIYMDHSSTNIMEFTHKAKLYSLTGGENGII